MNDFDEEAVGIPEIARMLKVSRDTVYRLAGSGRIPGFKVGGQWRFFPSKIRDYLSSPKDPWVQPARALRKQGRAA